MTDDLLEYTAPNEALADPSPHNPWLSRTVWVVAGFNMGFIVPLVVAFALLPLIAPDYAPKQAEDSPPPVQIQEIAYVIVSQTPSHTPLPSPTIPTQTPLPTETVSEVAQSAPASASPQPMATDAPPTQTPRPTFSPVPPTATPLPAPVSYRLEGIEFYQQGWNNCGPANLAMSLSYYGWEGDQNDTAAFLKPNDEDKNVSPGQMIAYVNENTNLSAIYRVGGTVEQLQWLVSNEFAVIVETGYQPPGDNWYGHYFTVVGYDKDANEFQFYDSFLGSASSPITRIDKDDFRDNWQAFNYTYLVIYPPARELELQNFLGREWNPIANWRSTLERARTEAADDPDNAYAWFNVGTALTMTGDYSAAARAFDQAFNIGLPWRMLWYQFGPFEAYFQSSRLDDVVAIAEATIRTTPYVEETYFYLGRVYETRGDIAGAIEQYEKALAFNENFADASAALQRLGAA